MKPGSCNSLKLKVVSRAALLGFGVLGLAPLPSRAAAAVTPARAWPPPPAKACIVYVRSISTPADVGAKPAALSRVGRWLTGAKAESAALVRPFGLAVDDSGNLLVTDTGSGAVCCLEFESKKWLRWEQVGDVRFESPVAVARQGSTIFVAESAVGKVIAFDLEGRKQFEIAEKLERPSGLAASAGHLYIADSQRHCVVITDLKGQFISEFGRRGAGPGEFNFPTHVAVDAAGSVYVTDSLNYRVEVFGANGKFLRVIGSAGDAPGHFSRPKGVAVDTAGHAYVVDALFDNVQIFDSAGRLLLDWGQSGSEPGEFWLPNAIAISAKNEIYVADSYNRRIQVFRYMGEP